MPVNLHCPFCGYNSEHTKVVADNKNYVKVECQNCYSSSKPALRHSKVGEPINKYDIQRAYTNWNMRSDELDAEDFDSDYDGGYREDDWGDR